MKKDLLMVRICAVCAGLTAVTTFLLWLLPKYFPPTGTFDQRVLLHLDPLYMTRLWDNFVHIPLAIAGYAGLAFVASERAPLMAKLGMTWFAIWGAVEMIGVSSVIFSVNKNWRPAYLAADAAEKLMLKSHIELFYSLWDSMFFVLLVAFLLGTSFFGAATWHEKGLGKFVSILFWLGTPLTLLIMLNEYWQVSWGGTISDAVYPFLQPVSRLSLGAYLWKQAGGREEVGG